MTTTEQRMADALRTPGPWKLRDEGAPDDDGFASRHIEIESSDELTVIAQVCDGIGWAEQQANARRIVQCVNAHDTLVSALRDILAYCVESVPESPCHADLDTIGDKASDALAAAGAQQ